MNFKGYIKCESEKDVSDSYQQRTINHVIGGQCMFWFAVLTPWTVAPQALLFMVFSSQEYLSGLPVPSPLSTILVTKCVLQKLVPDKFRRQTIPLKRFTIFNTY